MSKPRHHDSKLRPAAGAVRAEAERVFRPLKPRAYGDAKSVIGDLIAGAGGPKDVAHRFGLHLSMIYAFADPASDKDMSFARAASLTAPENTVAAEYLAHLAGGVFMPVPRGDGAVVRLTGDLAREIGEAVSTLLNAANDGTVDEAEALQSVQQLDESLVVLMTLRAEVLAKTKRGRP